MIDILQIRAPGYNFYVLKDEDKLYLIDGGFIGGWRLLQRSLRKRNWESHKIEGILVTDGHLDHILNLNTIKEKTGGWIAAPKHDVLHYQGIYPYGGLSKGVYPNHGDKASPSVHLQRLKKLKKKRHTTNSADPKSRAPLKRSVKCFKVTRCQTISGFSNSFCLV